MTRTLKEIYSQNEYTGNIFFSQKIPVISYEVFPPKNDTDRTKLNSLITELDKLKKHNPALISITYGAGGSNQSESLHVLDNINRALDITCMPHFTCVSTSCESIKNYVNTIESMGIKNILALRGDIPEGSFCKDFEYASDLIEYIKSSHNLSVAAAGYPEGHNECMSLEKDIEWLRYKVNKGVDVVYTQMFFDNTKFFDFIELCADKGINAPIIPGILPVTSFSQLEKMTSMCKVTIPKCLIDKLEAHKDDLDYTRKIGIDFATYQCQQLVDAGVPGLHFYTLNKSFSVGQILDNIL